MSRYLLDTHVVLWLATDPGKLSKKVLDILVSNAPKSVSIASVWEVAIKLSRGGLEFKGGIDEFYKIADSNNLTVLQLRRPFLKFIETLDFNIHKDPFDRMIIATAAIEDMTIITIDKNIQKYDIAWAW